MSYSVLRMQLSPIGAIAALALFSLLFALHDRAAAVPLDAEECRKLWAEHKEMIGTGIEAKLVKGPVWGLANLTAEELDGIRHFLSIEEQLQFRCPLIQPPEPQALKASGPVVPLPTRRPASGAKPDKSAGIKADTTQSN